MRQEGEVLRQGGRSLEARGEKSCSKGGEVLRQEGEVWGVLVLGAVMGEKWFGQGGGEKGKVEVYVFQYHYGAV